MKNLLKCLGLWDLVEKGCKVKGGNGKASKRDQEKDSMILEIILEGVDDKSVSRCVVGAKSSKEAWDSIKTQYKGITHQSIKFNINFISL